MMGRGRSIEFVNNCEKEPVCIPAVVVSVRSCGTSLFA
eukprot:SAG31_NODE_26111_length_448_cov_0.822350_1_plen_37_part_10